MSNNSLTGYPSIDKPWLKYYSEEAINAPLPDCTIYKYLWENNKDHLEDIALNYFGQTISYNHLFQNINHAASSFQEIGVSPKDNVSLCMLNMPETFYSVYGLNRLGAVSNIIEPRTNPHRIRDRINDANSSVLIVVDIFLHKILEIADETALKTIIVVPLDNSMTNVAKASFVTTLELPSDNRCISWNQFLNFGNEKNTVDYPYFHDAPAVIIYTGGTTGVPKGAVLTNDSIIAMAIQSIYDVPQIYEGERFLGIMPPFIAYGFVFGMFIPLCAGHEIVLIPNFDPKEFDKLILQYKPNHVFGVPAFFEKLARSKKIGDSSMEFLICAITGGDQLLESTEMFINEFLHKHHCKYNILKGYGMTELGSAATFTSTDSCNIPGSVGIPTHRTTVKVIDHNTDRELGYNQLGELCMTSDTMMAGYFNNDAETKKVMRKHVDGRYWIHTGDIGYMTEDGVIFLKGRMKRMIIRPDGHNVWPSQIEEVITRHPSVAQCVVIGLPDSSILNGKIPTAFIVVKDGTDETKELLEEIEAFSKIHLPERDTASQFCFIDEIPMTPVGKVDYRALEKLAEEEILNA